MKYLLILICFGFICGVLSLEVRNQQDQVLVQELEAVKTKEILLRIEILKKEIDSLKSIYGGTTRQRSKMTVAVGDLPSYKDFSNRTRDDPNQ